MKAKAFVLLMMCVVGVETGLGQTLFREGDGVFLGTTNDDTQNRSIGGLNLSFRLNPRLDVGFSVGFEGVDDFALGVGAGYTAQLPGHFGARAVVSVGTRLLEPVGQHLDPQLGGGVTLFRQVEVFTWAESFPGVSFAFQTDFGSGVFEEQFIRLQAPTFISLGSSVRLIVNPHYNFVNDFRSSLYGPGFGLGFGLRFFNKQI